VLAAVQAATTASASTGKVVAKAHEAVQTVQNVAAEVRGLAASIPLSRRW
jgi:hypothetical protein